MSDWKDVSSYSQNDTERIPKSWELRVGEIRVVVTRLHASDPLNWYLTCDPFFKHAQLAEMNIDAAKDEAILRVQLKLDDVREGLIRIRRVMAEVRNSGAEVTRHA